MGAASKPGSLSVTVIKSINPNVLCKRYTKRDGKLIKKAVAHVTEGTCRTLPVPDAQSMAKLLARVTQSKELCIVPGVWDGAAGVDPFDLVTEDELCRLAGGRLGEVAGGVHAIGARRVAARIKRGIKPSAWLLIDADNPPGIPDEWATMSLAERLAFMEPLLPGVSTCERVELRGSSARVVNGSAAGQRTHAWLRVSHPELIETMKARVGVDMVNAGLAFPSPRYSRAAAGTVIGHEQRTVVDLSVWTTGRIVFNARPELGAGMDDYTVADAGIVIVNEGAGELDLSREVMPSAPALREYKARTGVELSVKVEGGQPRIVSTGQLTMGTEIESKGTTKTLAQWISSMKPGDKLRCEAPFRASQSEAAMIRMGDDGKPIAHDVGNGTTYRLAETVAVGGTEDDDHHRNAPKPAPACLYGLIGDIARAAGATTEASPYATALNALAYLGCCLGRGPYLPVGNTYHHARLFGMHVGRSGRGRKGDAVSLLHRVDMALRAAHPDLAPQVHRGGLSSREGLAYLIHDGFKEGKNEVAPIHDKRLWVIESEFANVLHQTKRDGNTLSAALRDCWDGVGIKPATKSNRISASHPHVSMSAAVTTTELLSLIGARELSNGFANRFLVIFSERTKLEPFPKSTPQADVDALAGRVAEVLRFAQADRWTDRDHMHVSLSPKAAEAYGQLYLGELNRYDYGPLVTGLLERRAPVLLRIAMIFALTDQTHTIDLQHLDAALAWIRYWTDSVRFIFSSAAQEQVQHEVADSATKIVAYLAANGRQPRTKINVECFHGKLSRDKLDAALDELLHASPPAVIVKVEPRKDGPGSPTKFYVLAAKSAKSAKCEDSRGFAADSVPIEISEISEVWDGEDTSFRSVRSVRQPANPVGSLASAHVSLNPLISPASADVEEF